MQSEKKERSSLKNVICHDDEEETERNEVSHRIIIDLEELKR